MDSKSGLGSAADREARLKFSLLAALVWVFLRFNRPYAECDPLRDTARSKSCDG